MNPEQDLFSLEAHSRKIKLKKQNKTEQWSSDLDTIY